MLVGVGRRLYTCAEQHDSSNLTVLSQQIKMGKTKQEQSNSGEDKQPLENNQGANNQKENGQENQKNREKNTDLGKQLG